MTTPPYPYPPFAPLAEAIALDDRLQAQGSYRCPICRHGQIQALALMETFGCNFCRHLFAVDLRQQTAQVLDTAQPLTWRWVGNGWRSQHQTDPQITGLLWLLGLALTLLPASLVGLAAYIFPPLTASPGSALPIIWVTLTFFSHVCLVAWLLVEHYQWPLYLLLKAQLQHWTTGGSRSPQP